MLALGDLIRARMSATASLLLCAAMVGCAPDANPPGGTAGPAVTAEAPAVVADEPGRFYDREAGYSVKLPEGWTREGENFMSPDLGEADPFVENARVVTANGAAEGPEAFLEEALPGIRANLANFEEVERSETYVGGEAAIRMTYTYSDSGLNGKCLAYVVSKDDRHAVIILTALDTTFDESKPAFEELANSFRFEQS